MKLNLLFLYSVRALHAQMQSPKERIHAHRNTTIDLARIVAALGVISAHVFSNTDNAGRIIAVLMPIRVPFFYSISLFLFIVNLPRVTPIQVASRVWRRLLVPYLSWTILYITLLITKSLFAHGYYKLIWWRMFLYGESAIQLYFLPTLFMLQAVALGLYLLLVPGGARRSTGWLLLIGTIIYYSWGAHCRCTGMGEPYAFIGYAMYLVAAFGLAFTEVKYRGQIVCVVLGIGLLMLVICCNWLGHKILFWGYPLSMPLGGIGSLLLVTRLPTYWRYRWLPVFTSLSFGIYLCHPLFIELFDYIIQYNYPVNIPYALNSKMLEVLLVFVASGGLVLLLRQIKPIRQLLLGEQ